MTFEAAQQVADAVLYEGYLLYPYRASSDKNRVRFQFGVVAPMDFSLADGSETWETQTECLVDAAGDARIDVRVRFLQLQARSVETVDAAGGTGFVPVASLVVGDDEWLTWEEAIEGQVEAVDLSLTELRAVDRTIPFTIAGGEEIEPIDDRDGLPAGRIVRSRWQIDGFLRASAEAVDGYTRLRVRVENLTASPPDVRLRDEALRRSLLGCHTLLAVRDGSFLSLIDPPPAAAAASKGCVNLKTWPVLVADEGRPDLMLSSPIILYDHPAIAKESPNALFDGTEIDEILTLRIMTLSDEEKRAARATDPRAKAIIDAADDMPPEILDRLHGAIRYLRETPNREVGGREGVEHIDHAAAIRPWSPDGTEPDWPTLTTASLGLEPDGSSDLPPSVWAPDARVPPDRAAILIDGMTVSKGASVRLQPNRRADSMDVFLRDRRATVEAVYESVDDDMHVAVTLDDDPGNDLQRETGRFFYFAPDELEPLAPAPAGAGPAPVILERSARSRAMP
jgi:hypothetical protein